MVDCHMGSAVYETQLLAEDLQSTFCCRFLLLCHIRGSDTDAQLGDGDRRCGLCSYV